MGRGLLLSIGLILALGACESSHRIFGPATEAAGRDVSDRDGGLVPPDSAGDEDAPSIVGDAVGDAGGVTGPLTSASCDAPEGGVSVGGGLRLGAAIPPGARLWLSFADPAFGIPQCFVEVSPVEFPCRFVFDAVPDEPAWGFTALLDVDGGFPPVPAVGDYVATVPPAELDLSRGDTDLDLVLTRKEQ